MARLSTALRTHPVRPLDFPHLALLAFQAGVLGIVAIILALALINTVLGVPGDSTAAYIPSY